MSYHQTKNSFSDWFFNFKTQITLIFIYTPITLIAEAFFQPIISNIIMLDITVKTIIWLVWLILFIFLVISAYKTLMRRINLFKNDLVQTILELSEAHKNYTNISLWHTESEVEKYFKQIQVLGEIKNNNGNLLKDSILFGLSNKRNKEMPDENYKISRIEGRLKLYQEKSIKELVDQLEKDKDLDPKLRYHR